MYAICNLSHVPVRSEPSDKSEMVSELLFGEIVEIVDKRDGWRKVKMLYDNYIGWLDKKQVVSITDEFYQRVKNSVPFVSSDLVQIAVLNNNQIFPVVMGSSLPVYLDKKFYIGETEYAFEGNVIDIKSPQPERILEHAYMYLNSPYLWGGRSPFGIDCSGFTQVVFKQCGIKLLRDASQQAEQGLTINLLEESQPGDLAFFSSSEKNISHVGILLPNNLVIHASGKVRIDRVDHQGIFNEETKEYTHTLRVIKRISRLVN